VKKVAAPIPILYISFLFISLLWSAVPSAVAQDEPPQAETPTAEEQTAAPEQVDVEPSVQDEQIDARLTRILQATGWFSDPTVEVQEGVVFLDGRTQSADQRDWAGNLARNTQDVVAVVNRIQIVPGPVWDFSPAWAEMRTLWRGAVQSIPVLVFGTAVLLLSWWLARLVSWLSRLFLRNRLNSPLLTSIASRTIAIPVFLLGLYLVLQVAGLTRLALTVLGGTGVVGIVVGIAFRDIAENFLASVLLSVRQPFHRDDLIEVAGYNGIVQQMNTRSTVLMTLDGNHVQIPNATVYKNTIINYTANPNRRSDFVIGIGYEDAIARAQDRIDGVLREHPAVLATPEPLVLVDELGAATVNLRVYFWYDATLYAPIKIKSSLVRLTKRTLEDAGISMPDEAREVIFPRGVPLIQAPPATETQPEDGRPEPYAQPAVTAPPEPVTTAAEGDLRSDEGEIRAQAEQSRAPEEGGDLLEQG